MALYSRRNKEESRLTDEVYAVIQRHGSVPIPKGILTRETGHDSRSVLAALELLEEEEKIVITAKKRPEDKKDPITAS